MSVLFTACFHHPMWPKSYCWFKDLEREKYLSLKSSDLLLPRRDRDTNNIWCSAKNKKNLTMSFRCKLLIWWLLLLSFILPAKFAWHNSYQTLIVDRWYTAIGGKIQRPLGGGKFGRGTFSMGESLVFGETSPSEDLTLRSKKGHEVDCERSDSNALAISLIQRLKQHHYRLSPMYRCR